MSDLDLMGVATLDVGSAVASMDTLVTAAGAVGSRMSSALSSGFSGLEGQINSRAGSFKNIGSTIGQNLVGGMTSQFGAAGQAAGQLATALGPVGVAATAVGAGILAVGSAVSSSVNVAGNFQQQMVGVAAIMYDGTKSAAENVQMQQELTAAAREAGATTQFSASQAGQALGYMAGAGWNSTQATAALKDTLTLAAAGSMDLAQAGDLMTNTVSQFGLAATDAGRVSNVLAAGASATNTSVGELGAGLKVTGSMASAFGWSLESTTTALGQLSNAGIKGAEGGTALRGILASLANQTGPATAALQDLGVSAEDIDPATHSLSESMGLLQERGMTAAQAIQIFGRENVSAATYLAENSSKLDGLQTSITGTTKASEMAAIQTNTYRGAMGELSSAFEEAQISLGDVFLPTVTEGVNVLTDVVNIGTAAGKAIYDFAGDVTEATAPIAEAFRDYTPMGWVASATSDLASDAWGDLKQWAGIGDSAAEGIAEGVKENESLTTAPAEALQSPEAAAAATEAADVFGDNYLQALKDLKVSSQIATYIASGFSDSAALAAYNNQNSKANDEYVRNFEYLGKQISLTLQRGGSGWFDAWKVGDTLMGSTQQGGETYDPVAAFEMIMGMPAPEECTAAYYDLIGDSISARKIELQEAMKPDIEFDYSDLSDTYGDLFTRRFENEGARIAKTASDTTKETFTNFLENLRSPMWSELSETLDYIDSLITSHELDPSEGALWASTYKEVLVSGITDITEFAKSQSQDMNSQIASAFSDFDFSEADKKMVLAMKPMLDTIKSESPKAFGEAGLASVDKFVEMAQSGSSSEELYAFFESMGTKAGNSFEEALGIAFKDPEFNWNRLYDERLASTLGDSNLVNFRENMVQPEVIENAAKALDLWNKGVPEFQDYSQKVIESFYQVAEANEWVFTDEQRRALREYKSEQIGEVQLLEIMANKTEKLAKETQKFTEEEEDACAECGKLLSAFGAWQEGAAAPYLFRASYAGPSYGSWGEAAAAGRWADDLLMNSAIGTPEYDVAVRVKTTLADESKNAYNDWPTARGLLKDLFSVDPEGAKNYNVDFTVNVETSTATANLNEVASRLDDINLKANEIQQIDRKIVFKDAEPGATLGLDGWIKEEAAETPVPAILALDTTAAMSEFEAFRATIESATITATLTTQTMKLDESALTDEFKQISFEYAPESTRLLGLGERFEVDEDIYSLITPLSLDTTAAMAEFQTFREAIEGTTINTTLKANNAVPEQASTAQGESTNSTILTLQEINTNITQSRGAIISTLGLNGNQDRAVIREGASGIVSTISTSSASIIGAINNGVSVLSQVLKSCCGDGSGGGGLSGGLGGTEESSGSGSSTSSVPSGYISALTSQISSAAYSKSYSVASARTASVSSAVVSALSSYAKKYSFSDGGYVDEPTWALVGDSPGGEYMVPQNRLDEFMASASEAAKSTSLDSTDISNQLQSAIQGMSGASIRLPLSVEIDTASIQSSLNKAIQKITVPKIPVQLAFDVDSEALRSALTDILYDILSGVKL